ncbi:MAG TPA: right-handed parallel beta-helix repeat-containing protein [Polyangiaceae bacterium]
MILGLVVAPAACSSSSGDAAPDDGLTSNGTTASCADGFQKLDGEVGCGPVLATDTCGPGTMPTIGNASCVPVGPTSCPAGFTTAANGFGCDTAIPETACTGATRDAVGSSTCVPVGDCNAAFPPSNATLFVDASYTAGQIDATHFTSVSAAMAVATSGAVIAIESGTYTDVIAPKVPVDVVGRCAEKVIFDAADTTKSAVQLDTAVKLGVSNMTFRNYHATIGATVGDLTVDSVVVEDSHFAGIVIGNKSTTAKITNTVVRGTRGASTDANVFGLYIGYGAQVTVTDSAFVDNDYIGVGVSGDGTAGAKLALTSSVVRDGHPFGSAGGFGWGVYASDLVTVDVESSAIVNNRGFGVLANSQKATTHYATVKLGGSVVRGTVMDPVAKQGMGIESNMSSLDLEGTTVADNEVVDVYAAGGGKTSIASSALLGTSNADPTVLGPLGLVVVDGPATVNSTAIVGVRAGAELEGTTVADVHGTLVAHTRSSNLGYYVQGNYDGIGIFLESAGQLAIDTSTISDTYTAGLITLGQTTVDHVLVTGTKTGADGVGGRGLSAQGSSNVTVSASALVGNAEAGVVGAQHGALTITDTTIDQTSLDTSGAFGIGIYMGVDDVPATIASTTIHASAGPGIAASDAGLTMKASAVVDNVIGIAVLGSSSLVEGDGNGAPTTVAISKDTLFVGNETRVGTGNIPLPDVLAVPEGH